MNLREMVAEYAVLYLKLHQVRGVVEQKCYEDYRRQFDEAEQRVKQAIELAEAAIEHCEAIEQIDKIMGGSVADVDYVATYEKINKTYRQWLESRESRQERGTSGKEWWHAK